MYGDELRPSSANLRTHQPSAQSTDLRYTAALERLTPDLNNRRQQVQYCIPNQLSSVQIQIYAYRVEKCTHDVPGSHWQLFTALYWLLRWVLPSWDGDVLGQWELARRACLTSVATRSGIRTIVQSRKVRIHSQGRRLHLIFNQMRWNPDRVRPHIHHQRLADFWISSGFANASWFHQLLLEIHQEIYKGDSSHINLAKDTRLTEVGMDSGWHTRISEDQNGFYWSTDPPALQLSKTDHSTDRWKRHHNQRPPQSVQQIWDSSPSELLLRKMVSCRTELRYIWLGDVGHCCHNETMESLSRGHQSEGPDPVRPQESQVFPNLQSALPTTG